MKKSIQIPFFTPVDDRIPGVPVRFRSGPPGHPPPPWHCSKRARTAPPAPVLVDPHVETLDFSNGAGEPSNKSGEKL